MPSFTCAIQILHRNLVITGWCWLQTTQPTSGGAVTANSSCCANCVEPPRPQQWGPDLPFFSRPCGPAGWLALLLTKAGDVETNPGPTTQNKKVWICDICHKQIQVRKQISIRFEHWVHLMCRYQAQYTDTWAIWVTQTTPQSPLPTLHLHHPHHRNQNTVSNILSTHTAPCQTRHMQARQPKHLTCTTHTRTYCNHTSPRPHTSTAVNLTPSHSHSTHTCNVSKYMHHSHRNNRMHNMYFRQPHKQRLPQDC